MDEYSSAYGEVADPVWEREFCVAAGEKKRAGKLRK
jgi:hypothetical protein